MNPSVALTRRVRFSAAHRYARPEWTDAENRAAFGACSNPHGHGHNYLLEVTVRGEVDPLTGFCVDLPALDALLHERVVAVLDHQHLNHAVPEFAAGAQIPTSENILLWIADRLGGGVGGARVVRLRLWENEDFYVETGTSDAGS